VPVASAFFNKASAEGVESVLPKQINDWIPPALSKTVNKTLQTPAVQNVGPLLEGDLASMLVTGATVLNSAVDLGNASVDVYRAAAGTEAMIDAGLILALLAQGLPRWFLSREGGRLLLKMVESGVAAELLKQGNLIKLMVDRRLLERMLELKLLDTVLTKGDLTKRLISQGVLRELLEKGVIEAMIHPNNEAVLFQLLEGKMLEVMVDSNILYGLQNPTGADKPPPSSPS